MEFNATFIVSAISFVVFSIIMNAIFYNPLSKVVAERQKFLDDNYNKASLNKEKAVAILQDKADKIEDSKHQAKKIITEKADSAKESKALMAGEAQKKAAETIDSAKSELQNSKNQAKEVLSNEVYGLAQNISSKILGEDIAINNVDKEFVDKIMQEG